jgi:hypothetical protein
MYLYQFLHLVRTKPEIDRIVFANNSRIIRLKPRIVRNIESNFIFVIFVVTNEQYA